MIETRPRCPKCDVPLEPLPMPHAGMLWRCESCEDCYEGTWILPWDRPIAKEVRSYREGHD